MVGAKYLIYSSKNKSALTIITTSNLFWCGFFMASPYFRPNALREGAYSALVRRSTMSSYEGEVTGTLETAAKLAAMRKAIEKMMTTNVSENVEVDWVKLVDRATAAAMNSNSKVKTAAPQQEIKPLTESPFGEW